MDFLPTDIENYVIDHTGKEPEILKSLNHETWEKILTPRMLSGHLQGRVLSMITQMINPKRILEIGTYTGYSSLCFAEGLTPDGKIFTIDINEELESIADKYIELSGLRDRIVNIIGNAIDVIPTLNESFDLVFIDADKTNYSSYYDLVFDKVLSGGYIIADNVLWSGKVVQPKEKMDEDTIALVKFSKKVQEDNRVSNVLLPVRDGLMIVRKK